MPEEKITKNYFRVHFLALRIIGADFHVKFPNTAWGKILLFLQQSYTYFMQGSMVMLLVLLEVMQTPLVLDNTDRLMANIGFTINHFINGVRSVFFWKKGRDLEEMVQILEKGMRRYRQDEELIQWAIRRSVLILIGFLCIISTVVTCGTLNSNAEAFVFVEGVNATKNVTLHLPYEVYSMWIPSPGWRYHLASFYQVAALWYGGVFITIADALVCAFLLHIRCQFITLQRSLSMVDVIAMKRLLKRGAHLLEEDIDKKYIFTEESYNSGTLSKDLRKVLIQYYTDEEIQYEISVYLKECIQHHSDIIECVRLFESTYNVPLLGQLGASFLTVCSAIFQLGESEIGSVKFTMSLFFFSHMILQLALVCLTGNEVTEQSLMVHAAVYRSQWVGSKGFGALKSAVDLRMIMMRAARPVYVTAAHFTTLSAGTFLAVVKGAYSYYSVIKS